MSSSSANDRGTVQQPPRISACIVCRNEADKLGPCLASVAWADEILVMDLSSEDGSVAVARAHGAQVMVREPFPIVEPLRNELATMARGEWILALDPDERVTPALAETLQQLAARADIDAIVIPRMNYDFGYASNSPIQRYEPQLRMYRRATVEWPVVPNRLPTVPEERKHYLPHRDEAVILHERNRNIPEAVERVMRYAPAQAQSMIDQGQPFSLRDMIRALAAQIDKELFWTRAWEDGVPGILRAIVLVAYKFYVWAALWQLSGAQRTAADDRLLRQIGTVLLIGRRTLGVAGRVYGFLRSRLPRESRAA
jgi:(heptosyl)LPS beta-1,4-glucosyltransferase